MYRPISFLRKIFRIAGISFSGMLLIVGATTFTGCFHKFYEAAVANTDTVVAYIDTLPFEGKYFILRNGDQAFHMQGITKGEDGQSLKCTLFPLSVDHMLYANGERSHMRYKSSKPEKAVLNEVHIYISPDSSAKLNSSYVLNTANILKIERLQKDERRTANSTTFSLIGIGTVSFVAFIYMYIAIAQPMPPY